MPWRSRLRELFGKGKILPRVRGIGPINRRDFLKLGGAGLAGATLLGVAGCGGGEQVGSGGGGGGGGGGGTFTYGRGADSVSLDPIHATDGESFVVTRQVMDTLLAFEPGTTDPVPALATEVPQPEDGGRRYTFNIREGIKFHDGEPLNAEAIKFNYDRWQDTKNEYHTGGGNQSSNFAYYTVMFGGFDDDSYIESVEAPDETTLRFTLREPLAPFVRNVAMSAFAIASPKAIEEDVEGLWQKPVGSGPFKFESWRRGSEVRLVANEDFWGKDLPPEVGGGGPNVDRLVIRSIPDNTARVAALSGGELSGADGLTPDDVPTVEENEDLKVLSRPPLNIAYLAMNCQKEPFTDPRVRRAINYAINRPEIVKSFFGETGQVASNAMPPTVPYFREATEPYPYDPDEARRLLEEAGLGDGFDMELWYMPIPRPYMPDGRGVAQAMQGDLEEVGINAKLVTREWGTYLEETGTGAHDAAMLGWSGDNGDPDNFLNVLLSSASATEEDAQNIAYYKNPELDDLLRQGATTVDENERRRLYEQAQEIIYNDAPWVCIEYAEVPLGYQADVEGVTPNPVGNEEFTAVRLTGGGA
ncbi:MAG: Dipeptide-binding ABC transporter, periplasmic substrate-binding component [uncultured Rubrobacteraceae bacterium]|uniref:Dipeptide-binding ABC transporter, periplasmic substrate-binding component n=1 Tax=uncultured Rubrobacteraceae bacterium TaxID=349277 RepID=A0A6J4U4V5_9ACTN|nr:MAG: Dipeptide-binding ABC transporter, periplasmic substrate-binding component [uncultured Rubrobacteraceae bacterium]